MKRITHGKVWALAWPIMISNISVPLVGAVDTAVVGRLPEPQAIGAVALGALIFSFIFWSFGFLKMGTSGFIARAFGARDQQAISETLLRVFFLALIFGGITLALSYPLIESALLLLNSSQEVEKLVSEYAYIRIWSAPATLCTYVCIGVFIGTHNTRRVLALQLVLNISNILLDILFVFGFEMGVEGVALATLIAEYLAAIYGFWLLRQSITMALSQFDWHRVADPEALRVLMAANSDIFIRTFCLVFAFSYFTAKSASHGELVLAANAILMHLMSLMAYALDGFAHAAEALAGSAYGARKTIQFRRVVTLTSFWGGVTATLGSLVYLFSGEWLLGMFTDIEAVLVCAAIYLPWMVASPILSFMSYQLDGIFIGSGHTRDMRNAMVISVLVYLFLVQYLEAQWGNHGLFLSLNLFMVIRALTLLWYYPGILRRIDAGFNKYPS